MAKFMIANGHPIHESSTENVDYAGSIAIQDGEVLKFVKTGATPGWQPVGAVAYAGGVTCIAAEAKAATDSAGTIKVFANPFEEFWALIAEIENETELACESGSGNAAWVDASFDSTQADSFIGMVIESVTLNAGDVTAGTQQTITDDDGAGTLAFSAIAGALAYVATDTAKVVSVGRNLLYNPNLGLYYVDGSTADEGCMVALDAATGSDLFTIIGVNKLNDPFPGKAAGTLVKLRLTNHYNNCLSALYA